MHGGTLRTNVTAYDVSESTMDVFASCATDDCPTQTQAVPPFPLASYGQIAARNEGSILFTVSDLRAKAARRPHDAPESAPDGSRGPSAALPPSFVAWAILDSDGLIDLYAPIDASASSATPGAVIGGALRVRPLFGDPPVTVLTSGGGSSADASGVHAKRTSDATTVNIAAISGGPGRITRQAKVAAAIGATAASVVFGIIGLTALTRAEHQKASAIAAAAAPVTRTHDAADRSDLAPGVFATSGAAANPSATGTDHATASSSANEPNTLTSIAQIGSAASSKSSSSVGAGPSKRGHGSRSGSTSKTKSSARSSDTCGCRGDFNCLLRCSAKGR